MNILRSLKLRFLAIAALAAVAIPAITAGSAVATQHNSAAAGAVAAVLIACGITSGLGASQCLGANTLGTTNGKLIAMRTMKTLLAKFPLLRQITTDFSNEGALFNQPIVSHIVTAGTASDYDTTNGYVASDRTQVDVPLTIDQHKHHTYSVNDQERTSTNIKLIERFAATGAHALAKAMYSSLFGLLLEADYNQSIVAVASFDRDAVIDIGTALNGRDVSDVGRFMVLNSSYHGALFKDGVIVSNDQNPALPANAQNRVGFAGNAEGLVIATRLPKEPEAANVPGNIYTVTEPESGLSIQVREWYDIKLGKEFRTMTLMYGVAKGVTNNMQLIASAA